jgi:hypothetical protein
MGQLRSGDFLSTALRRPPLPFASGALHAPPRESRNATVMFNLKCHVHNSDHHLVNSACLIAAAPQDSYAFKKVHSASVERQAAHEQLLNRILSKLSTASGWRRRWSKINRSKDEFDRGTSVFEFFAFFSFFHAPPFHNSRTQVTKICSLLSLSLMYVEKIPMRIGLFLNRFELVASLPIRCSTHYGLFLS